MSKSLISLFISKKLNIFRVMGVGGKISVFMLPVSHPVEPPSICKGALRDKDPPTTSPCGVKCSF